jgi:uncharacterized phiE125 gp8 family phage protein
VILEPQGIERSDVLPLAIEDAKRHLRVSGNDDDQTILEIIEAAGEYVRVLTEATIVTTSYVLTVPSFPPKCEIELAYPPVRSCSVRYYDEANTIQTFASVYLDSQSVQSIIRLMPGYSWPTVYDRRDAVMIDYTAGLSSTTEGVPPNVKQALRLLVKHWYDNRDVTEAGPPSRAVAFSLESLLRQIRTGRYAYA